VSTSVAEFGLEIRLECSHTINVNIRVTEDTFYYCPSCHQFRKISELSDPLYWYRTKV